MVLLKFHGGCQQIGMSCVEIETQERRILLDCGMSPDNNSIPQIDDKNIDAVIVSHAHLDHCGAIPFYKFKKIYCTHPTADLMYLTWKDTLNLTKSFKEEDIQYAMESIETLNYYEEKKISENIKFKFYNAGHILGSASIYLEVDGKKILYTGDINEGPSRTLLPADTDIDEIDVLIIESTYGSPLDIKPSRKTLEKQLIEEISETIENGGKVIIPVFAIGRAQEILLIINNYMRSGKLKNVPIYTDGSLIHATSVYLSYVNWLNPKVKNMIESGINPFGDVKKADEKLVFNKNEPCIIVSTSGMVQGGPILKYLKLLKDPKNKIILTGYQAEGTLGRALEEGVKEIQPFKNKIPVRGNVVKIEFSAHGDYNSLVRYIKKIPKPEKAIVMHGERYQSLSFAMTIWKTLKIPTYVPVKGTILPI
ncbi:RNA-metabolising metallo-beta-lactamase [Methanocaldococcus lauensis]|uniref:RNA-metabolising metallo-beta-lactamase n=1 Tax=Methanocaldococcus lauensis TaxID=2546128 RepID=A0A8D6SVD0_9EURY|nr:MBL fold metallo-hydrolase [Methanocaldococcus lauensis]CAB3289601.1 RNA-metabolising metallo-beta-lactamase [Methanocaldococcus lauensis]